MSGTRITLDGLWRCLCPCIDELALSRAVRRPAPSPSPLPGRTPRRRPALCTAQWRARPIHTTTRPCNTSTAEAQASPRNVASEMPRNDGRGEEDRPVTAEDILRASTPPRHLLHRAPTTVIYDALRIMLAQPKRRPHLRAVVKYLVEHRAQTPNAFLYEALVASNWEPAGSAEEVRQILDEMRDLGVGTTSSLYHAALRALAVHPDYLLRNRIVAEMRERWLDLTPDGRCSVALGLLRDGQHELALDKLEAMLDAEDLPTIPSWVVDIFIVVLAQHTHLDEALSLLQRRTSPSSSSSSSSPASLSPNIWSLVLDECSRNYHYAGTRLAWDALVPTKLLNPSDGTCLNVLNTAARHSDARLATDVVAHLSARSAKLGAHHYEALVDSYAHRDDVSNALQALCIMARSATTSSSTSPSHASTASLRAAFRRNPALARAARDALLRLGETATVPLAAFNAVLDGLLLTHHDDEDMEEAFALYRQVRHVCGCGPDAHTFAPFVERMTSVDRVEAARFLADEMRAFGLPPARELYDRLVYLAAAVEGDLDAAFEVLGELEEQLEQKQQQHRASERGRGAAGEEQRWITAETALAVARACVARRDERVWGLLRSARRVGVDLGPAGRALEEEGAEWEALGGEEGGRKGKRDGGKVAERQVPPWLGDAMFREETAGRDVGSG